MVRAVALLSFLSIASECGLSLLVCRHARRAVSLLGCLVNGHLGCLHKVPSQCTRNQVPDVPKSRDGSRRFRVVLVVQGKLGIPQRPSESPRLDLRMCGSMASLAGGGCMCRTQRHCTVDNFRALCVWASSVACRSCGQRAVTFVSHRPSSAYMMAIGHLWPLHRGASLAVHLRAQHVLCRSRHKRIVVWCRCNEFGFGLRRGSHPLQCIAWADATWLCGKNTAYLNSMVKGSGGNGGQAHKHRPSAEITCNH